MNWPLFALDAYHDFALVKTQMLLVFFVSIVFEPLYTVWTDR